MPGADGNRDRRERSRDRHIWYSSPADFWVQRAANESTIVALSDDALSMYRKYSPGSKFRQAWRTLKQGVAVEEALSPATVIPYMLVERVESNLRGLTLCVFWIGGRATGRRRRPLTARTKRAATKLWQSCIDISASPPGMSCESMVDYVQRAGRLCISRWNWPPSGLLSF